MNIEEIAEQAAKRVVEENKIDRPEENEDYVSTLAWSLGVGINYEAGLLEIVRAAVEIDRAQRGIYELLAEALEERAELGGNKGASIAAREIRSELHDHIWTSYIGPVLDELEQEFGHTDGSGA